MRHPARYSAGFTLIELVVGIVVFSLALAVLANLFWSQGNRSIEAMFQIRAAQIGQALLDEILAKRFDEQTPVGGVPPCSGVGCTAASSFGSDAGESGRADYDDVDDYHDYCSDDGSGYPGWPVEDVFGSTPPGFGAQRFRMRVCVRYDGDYDGIADNNTNAKWVVVQIYPQAPGGIGNPIEFSVYRGNF